MADTRTETTVAEELKTAAAKLRRAAAGATPGRWVCGDIEEQPNYSQQVAISADDALIAEINLSIAEAAWRYMRHQASSDGQWIALASPALSEPLAAWLEETARQYDAPPCDDPTGVCNGCEHRPDFVAALATARAINGGAA